MALNGGDGNDLTDEFEATNDGIATLSGTRFVYNTTTGALFYDADGVEGSAGSQIATLTGAPTLDATDFIIVDIVL